MPAPLNRNKVLLYAGMVPALLLAGVLAAQLWVLAPPKPMRIKILHREIKDLQERLISAQITSRDLKEVQGLIQRNLAISASDTMAQGASLNFLTDLHRVLDNLGITVASLEPRPVRTMGRFLETPYDLEILCDYRQFTLLAEKMEKSPRLISLGRFEVDNSLEDYFNDPGSAGPGGRRCRVKLQITTVTLVRST